MNPWWNGRTPRCRVRAPDLPRVAARHVRPLGNFVQLISGRAAPASHDLRQLRPTWSGPDSTRAACSLDVGHRSSAACPAQILRIHREMILRERPPAVLLLDELHYGARLGQHVKAVLPDKAGLPHRRDRVVQIDRARARHRAAARALEALSFATLSFHEY